MECILILIACYFKTLIVTLPTNFTSQRILHFNEFYILTNFITLFSSELFCAETFSATIRKDVCQLDAK